ncbi:MAG: hypothetical protein IIB43_00635, partial [Candidatus Marinimicrobia bacterium]|nr:hypothetical protein [Candidatus Neomarinimicrobiota bacterium]
MGNKELILTILIIFFSKQSLGQSQDRIPSEIQRKIDDGNFETHIFSEDDIFLKYPEPIMKPEGTDFESKAVYNPTVIFEDGTINMIYRAEGEETGTGVLALAFSKDGMNFERYKHNPIIKPEFDYEVFGCEDPRIVKIEETYYLTYVGNDHGRTPGDICLATSRDLRKWEKHGEIIQPAHNWNRSK